MGIEVTSLRTLDSETVGAAEQLLSALINAYAPDVDTSGALRQLLIKPHAVLYTAARTEVDRLRRSSSLHALARDPELADEQIVDAAMSNYALQRRQATQASMRATLTFDSQRTVQIAETEVFEFGGELWNPAITYQAVNGPSTTNNVVSFSASPSGVGFWVQIDLVATSNGDRTVNAGDSATQLPALRGLLSAVAAGPAAGGTDDESNEDLLARAVSNVAPVSLATREGAQQLVRSAAPGALTSTVLGYGDAALARSRHNMFAVATPGFSDVYVRTALNPVLEFLSVRGFVRVTKEQLSPSAAADSLRVRCEVAGYSNAGAYEVLAALPVQASDFSVSPAEAFDQGLTIKPVEHERAVSRQGAVYVPTSIDGAFSAYQSTMYASVEVPFSRFAESDASTISRYKAWESYWRAWYVTQLNTATEQEYNAALQDMADAAATLGVAAVSSEFTAELDMWVWVAALPGLTAIQSAFEEQDNKSTVSYLVRAPYPCWITAELTIEYYDSIGRIDVPAVVAAVKRAVHRRGYTAEGGVRVGSIMEEVSNVLGDSGSVRSPVSLSARLRLPNDDVVSWSSSSDIEIPVDYIDMGVTPATSAFFITDNDIAISLEAAS